MKNIHIVIPDLFLPQQLAAYACKDLRLPALEKLLARADVEPLDIETLEAWLCRQFGVEELAIAPLTLQAEGVALGEGYYLRADPVGIRMQRGEMVLDNAVLLNADEAEQLCASLNVHFAADGLRFLAPHPQRWYVQLDEVPAMETRPLAQVVGANMHVHLPRGQDALRWHAVLNEIQMLFYEHAVNLAREQRGEAAISGVWLWGGGKATVQLLQPSATVAGDGELAAAFAQAAGLTFLRCDFPLPPGLLAESGDVLVVLEGLRSALQAADIGSWRNTVQQFERNIVVPLLQALQGGKVGQITLDVLSEGASRRFVLTRARLWRGWRLPKSLLHYALLQDSA